ncbi:MAG: cysteine desulfurase [Bacteroidetes bacterium]|nr:MAG: cysteine desulfurase [Bacteroidota bacterium]REK04661.1 MAG: cysteine desulfurase [Bacteroidota bacterium]REK36136.1 MAG: cysteine desulfurase [Bacteroidota bacterium]REK51493.1 MAG: cysteine desulfurase [Bacteroidota bacterium]
MNDLVQVRNKTTSVFDVDIIRQDFPVLGTMAYNKKLVYFDNAATSQKPSSVINKLTSYYNEYNANIHRGVHFLSRKATDAYDNVRTLAAKFVNASTEKEIIFVRGTTEAINLVASTFGKMKVGEGDEVLITGMEHHSNIVPWQMLCEEKRAKLRVVPISEKGEIHLEEFKSLITDRTKFISIVHTSNSLGTVNPVKEMIRIAREKNIPVMIDAAQAVVHENVDVQDLDCDFLAFSSHKMLGPTGVGVLYGKMKHLEDMPPYQGGGEMIHSVSFEKTSYNEVPHKFEAGTPNIADVIAFGEAINYYNKLDRDAAFLHEKELVKYALKRLQEIEGVKIIGQASERTSLVSFIVRGLNAFDIGMYLDTQGVAVRTGHHCTEPVMDRMQIPGTVRASFMFYNTKEEIEIFIEALKKAIKLLNK